MPFPLVQKGPCGCDLRSASLCIAWFSMVVLCITLISVGFLGTDAMEFYSMQPEGTAVTAEKFAEIITYILLVVLAIMVFINILLLIGIYKEKRRLIFVYICIKGSLLVLALIGTLQILASGHFVKENAAGVIFTFVEVYLVYLLYCYYKELSDFAGHVYDNQVGIKA